MNLLRFLNAFVKNRGRWYLIGLVIVLSAIVGWREWHYLGTPDRRLVGTWRSGIISTEIGELILTLRFRGKHLEMVYSTASVDRSSLGLLIARIAYPGSPLEQSHGSFRVEGQYAISNRTITFDEAGSNQSADESKVNWHYHIENDALVIEDPDTRETTSLHRVWWSGFLSALD